MLDRKQKKIFLKEVYGDSFKPKGKEELVSYLEVDGRDSNALPKHVRLRWSRAAFWLSVFCACVTLSFSLASFLVSSDTASSSIFANAFDAFLGTVSSVAVAWRFRDGVSGEVTGIHREKMATLGIGVSFVATGVATITASIIHLIVKEHPQKTSEMLIIVWCSLFAFLILACFQGCLARKLDSQSMWAARADSLLAAGMSFGILISTYAYCTFPGTLWWLDHAVALTLGVLSSIYGLHLVLMFLFCSRDQGGDDQETLIGN